MLQTVDLFCSIFMFISIPIISSLPWVVYPVDMLVLFSLISVDNFAKFIIFQPNKMRLYVNPRSVCQISRQSDNMIAIAFHGNFSILTKTRPIFEGLHGNLVFRSTNLLNNLLCSLSSLCHHFWWCSPNAVNFNTVNLHLKTISAGKKI